MYEGYLRLFGVMLEGYIEEACKPGKSKNVKALRREAKDYLHHNIYIEMYGIDIDKLIDDYLKSTRYQFVCKAYQRNLDNNRERQRRKK